MLSPSPTPVVPEQSATLFESHRVRHHGHHHRDHGDIHLASSSIMLQQYSSASGLPVPVSIMPTPTLVSALN